MSLAKAEASAPRAAKPQATLEPSAAEAPHRLPRYTEPRPFVTARSVKAFTATALVACGCAAALYRLLVANVEELDKAQLAAAAAIIPAPLRATPPSLATRHDVPELPQFAAPTTFSQLSQLTAKPENLVVSSKAAVEVAVRQQPLLHREAFGRLKGSWNNAIDALETSVVNLEQQRRNYVAAAAEAQIRARVEAMYPGSIVDLRQI
jgi:hypothetical protein